MKKKTVLSKEALGQLLGRDGNVSAEENIPKAEEEVQVEVEASEEVVSEEVTPEVVDFEVQLTEAKETIVSLEAKAVEVQEGFEAQLAEKDAAVEASKVDLNSMKGIVVAQISQMRVALSISDVDMSEWKAADVLKEYESTSSAFMKALPVGSVVPEENGERKAEVVSSHDVSAHKSLGF